VTACCLTAWLGVKTPRVERVREQFSEDELVHLSLSIVSINGWNRLNIAARTVPGDYVAGRLSAVHAASRSRGFRWTDSDQHSGTSGFELRVVERGIRDERYKERGGWCQLDSVILQTASRRPGAWNNASSPFSQ